MVADFELLEPLHLFGGLVACLLHLLQDRLVLELARLVAVEVDLAEPHELSQAAVRSGR